MFSDDLLDRAARLIEAYRRAHLRVATAESCTGGLLAALLTEISGSALVVERGLVTYSNEAKTEMLDVSAALIARYGAVSAETAERMAHGALERSHADIAVSITGIAGPTGGSPDKPVGLVHFACARRNVTLVARRHAFGDVGRRGIRLAAVEAGLRLLEEAVLAA